MKFETKRFLLKKITQKNATEDYLSWLQYFGKDGQRIIRQTQNSKKNIKSCRRKAYEKIGNLRHLPLHYS